MLSGDPTAAGQAANRHYVDTQVAGVTQQVSGKLGRAGDTPTSLADVRYANQFVGANVGAQIDAACADLGGSHGVVVIPSSMGAGWSSMGVPDSCLIEDLRGQGGSSGTAYYKSFDFYGRYSNTAAGLNIIQPLMVEGDAYAGGVSSGSNKTQYSSIHAEFDARTTGERKNVAGFMRCQGKGDCIGSAFWAQDWGGYSANGDEGNEGGRFEADQADGVAYPVPSGAVTAATANAVTVSWTGGSNAYLGEARPLINLSRGLYATGTVAGTAMSGGACTVTGTGTAWAATFGAGAHQDLFLEISGNNGTHLRWTVPVTQVVDDTHLAIEYNLAELGASCLGPWMTQSGAYKLYRGGTVSSLGAVIAGTKAPATVNLTAGGGFFQSGDIVEEPAGYNYHGTGVTAVVSRDVGEPQGSGVYVGNIGSAPFQNAFKSHGPFLSGIVIDSALSQDGLVFNQPIAGGFGPLLRSNDIASGNTRLMFWMNGSGAQRTIDYVRPSEVLSFPGGQYFSTNSSGMGVGTYPTPGVQLLMYNGTANQTSIEVLNGNAAGNATQIVTLNSSGIPAFKTTPVTTEFNNGMSVVGYGGNESGQTWSVSSASGGAAFATLSTTGKADFGTNVAVNDAAGTVYDSGLSSGGVPGISFNPSGAVKKFGIFGGSPGNSNGMLQFWDWTANQSILNYGSNGWTVPQAIAFSRVNGPVTVQTGDTGSIVQSYDLATGGSGTLEYNVMHNGVETLVRNGRGALTLVSTAAPLNLKPGNAVLQVTGQVVASNGFQNTGGATWMTGGAAPSGACVTGSLYSRTDAGATVNAALYVCVASAWVGK